MTVVVSSVNKLIPIGTSYDTSTFVLGNVVNNTYQELIPKVSSPYLSTSQLSLPITFKVYVTDQNLFYYWTGSAWAEVSSASAGYLASIYNNQPYLVTVKNSPPPNTGSILIAISSTEATWQPATNISSITLGSPTNGLSLSGVQLSLGLSSSITTGALSSSDWNLFNNKQNALVNPVTYLGSPTSTQIAQWSSAGVITGVNTTGTGNVVLSTSPNLISPSLGSATANTINNVTITSVATNATLTIQNGYTLTVIGNSTLSGTNSGDITLGIPLNGLSLSGQQLSLGLSSSTTTGALSSSDWNLFNSALIVKTTVSDINYTVTGTSSQAIAYSTLTVSRTIQLPPAIYSGQRIYILDESGHCNETITLSLLANGTDLIEYNSDRILNYPYASIGIESTGSGKWVIFENPNPNISAGIRTLPTYVNNGNGSITLGPGTYSLYTNSDGVGKLKTFNIPGNTFTLTDGVLTYIVANYNNGSPIIQAITTVSSINETTIIPIITVYRQGTTLYYLEWDDLGDALPNKTHQSIVKTQRYRLEPGGLTLGEAPTRYVTITSGTVWTGAVPTVLNAFNSSTNTMQLAYHVAGVWTFSTVTQYNNLNYDDGTNLQTTSGGKYVVNFIYRGVGTDTSAIILLGNANYNLGQAQVAQPPSSVPPLISSHYILVGRIIVTQGGSSAYQIDSAFSTIFTPTAAMDHNSLANLQGGTSGQYYHLTSSEYIGSGTGIFLRQTSPSILGVPTAPTAASNTNTTQLATTAFVLNQASSNLPLMDNTPSVGVSTYFSREDHIHPNDISKADKIIVSQTAHGFTTGQAVYFNGTSWALAEANSITTLGIGLVVYIDANTFYLYCLGIISGLSGLTAGQYYFVSDTIPGALTTTEPTSVNSFSNPILLAISSTIGVVLPFRPSEILDTVYYATEYDFLLDNEPTISNITYIPTRSGTNIINESWYLGVSTLFKTIDYTYTSGLITTEVRKLYANDGITIVAQSTIVYTYSSNFVTLASYTRNI